MTKKHILIGTTAINRSILHKDVIPEWYNYINVLDKSKYDVPTLVHNAIQLLAFALAYTLNVWTPLIDTS